MDDNEEVIDMMKSKLLLGEITQREYDQICRTMSEIEAATEDEYIEVYLASEPGPQLTPDDLAELKPEDQVWLLTQVKNEVLSVKKAVDLAKAGAVKIERERRIIYLKQVHTFAAFVVTDVITDALVECEKFRNAAVIVRATVTKWHYQQRMAAIKLQSCFRMLSAQQQTTRLMSTTKKRFFSRGTVSKSKRNTSTPPSSPPTPSTSATSTSTSTSTTSTTSTTTSPVLTGASSSGTKTKTTKQPKPKLKVKTKIKTKANYNVDEAKVDEREVIGDDNNATSLATPSHVTSTASPTTTTTTTTITTDVEKNANNDADNTVNNDSITANVTNNDTIDITNANTNANDNTTTNNASLSVTPSPVLSAQSSPSPSKRITTNANTTSNATSNTTSTSNTQTMDIIITRKYDTELAPVHHGVELAFTKLSIFGRGCAAVVTSVANHSAAKEAGLEIGDVILSMSSIKLASLSAEQCRSLFNEDQVRITITRAHGGKEHKRAVKALEKAAKAKEKKAARFQKKGSKESIADPRVLEKSETSAIRAMLGGDTDDEEEDNNENNNATNTTTNHNNNVKNNNNNTSDMSSNDTDDAYATMIVKNDDGDATMIAKQGGNETLKSATQLTGFGITSRNATIRHSNKGRKWAKSPGFTVDQDTTLVPEENSHPHPVDALFAPESDKPRLPFETPSSPTETDEYQAIMGGVEYAVVGGDEDSELYALVGDDDNDAVDLRSFSDISHVQENVYEKPLVWKSTKSDVEIVDGIEFTKDEARRYRRGSDDTQYSLLRNAKLRMSDPANRVSVIDPDYRVSMFDDRPSSHNDSRSSNRCSSTESSASTRSSRFLSLRDQLYVAEMPTTTPTPSDTPDIEKDIEYAEIDLDPSANLEWFAGSMPKKECEVAVVAASDGDFLIRESSRADKFVLCVNDEGVPISFAIEITLHQKCQLGERTFDDLHALIAYVRTHPVKACHGRSLRLNTPASGGSVFVLAGHDPLNPADGAVTVGDYADITLEKLEREGLPGPAPPPLPASPPPTATVSTSQTKKATANKLTSLSLLSELSKGIKQHTTKKSKGKKIDDDDDFLSELTFNHVAVRPATKDKGQYAAMPSPIISQSSINTVLMNKMLSRRQKILKTDEETSDGGVGDDDVSFTNVEYV